MGPTLPRYIVIMTTIFPNTFSVAVKFLDRPTVAVALTVSKNASRAEASLVAKRRMVDRVHMVRNVTATATAFLTAPSEMRRPNKVALFLLLMVANAEHTRTAIVTVFIPPAVPTGEPPINIRIMDTAVEAFVRCSCGMVAKPAVRVVTD